MDGVKNESVDQKGDVAAQNTLSSGEKALDTRIYLEGARFWLILVALAIMMLLVNIELPIVTTSVVAITQDLDGFNDLDWVMSSYLLGYVGLIVLSAKFSDIYGRKTIFILCISFFIVFSAACSAAQTITQLITFRAFQGAGGGASFSMGAVLLADLVRPQEMTKYVTYLSVVTWLSLLLGPIIGGAIGHTGHWRWIFIFNVPFGVIALMISVFAIPRGFPHQKPGSQTSTLPEKSASPLWRIDFVGAALILLATLGVTAAFAEAGSAFPWRSAFVITLLTVSGLLWIVLLLWERHISKKSRTREPVLPWAFLTNLKVLGVILNAFLLGGPLFVSILQIPQRFQLVYGFSGLDAGIRLIPFTLVSPVGTTTASVVAGKYKVPPVYVYFVGSCLQIIGFALMSTLPLSLSVPARIYGYEIIAGFGCGMNFGLFFAMVPFVTTLKDRAVGMGAGNQLRTMGSVIILAIATAVFNNTTQPDLLRIAGPSAASAIDNISQFLSTAPDATADQIRLVLAGGFNNQMIVLACSAAAQIPATLLLWSKKQIVL